MNSSNKDRYLEYFRHHAVGLKVCLKYVTGESSRFTAGSSALTLGLSIQTTTNALRDLERQGVLTSKKKGTTRVYRPRNDRAFMEALTTIQTSGLIGPRLGFLTLQSFENEFGRVLLPKVEMAKGTLTKDFKLETPFGRIAVDFLLKFGEISHIIEIMRDPSVEEIFGRASLISSVVGEVDDRSSIVFVVLANPRHFIPGSTALSDYALKNFGSRVKIMLETADETTLTKKHAELLIPKVWSHFQLSTS